MRDAIESQNGDPFRCIVVDGHTWMQDITINLHLCKRPQGSTGGDQQMICFPLQIPVVTPNSLLQFMPQHQNPNFPKLDAELQHVWEVFVNKLAEDNSTDVQPGCWRGTLHILHCEPHYLSPFFSPFHSWHFGMFHRTLNYFVLKCLFPIPSFLSRCLHTI